MSGMPWFRFYSEALADPKITRICYTTQLPKAHVLGAWLTLLAMANRSPERGRLMLSENLCATRTDMQAECGIDDGEFELLMEGFQSVNMVHQDERGCWVITNWEKRNFRSDNSTVRVRQWREGQQEGAAVEEKAAEERSASDAGGGRDGCDGDATLHGEVMKRCSNDRETDIDLDIDTDKDLDPDTEREKQPDTKPKDHAYADAGASGAENPRTFQAWHRLVTTSKNPNAKLREMVETLFPERSPPSYQYLGRIARQVGGPGRLADLLWQAAARPPTGDLLRYCQGMAKGTNGRAREPADPVAVREHVRRFLREDDGGGTAGTTMAHDSGGSARWAARAGGEAAGEQQ